MKNLLICLLAVLGLTNVSGRQPDKNDNKSISAETADTYEVDVFRTKSGKTLRFHALMHATICMEYDGKEFEIDPVQKLGNRTVDFTAMPKADYILISTRRPSRR